MSYTLDTPEHIKDRKKSGTVVPWHTGSDYAPEPIQKCTGKLTVTQEAYADVTRCDTCDYYDYWGIGD
jgi:hypothetical protein